MLVVYFIGFNTWRTTHLKDHVAAGRLSHQKHWKALKRSGACDDVCNIWKNWTDVWDIFKVSLCDHVHIVPHDRSVHIDQSYPADCLFSGNSLDWSISWARTLFPAHTLFYCYPVQSLLCNHSVPGVYCNPCSSLVQYVVEDPTYCLPQNVFGVQHYFFVHKAFDNPVYYPLWYAFGDLDDCLYLQSEVFHTNLDDCSPAGHGLNVIIHFEK